MSFGVVPLRFAKVEARRLSSTIWVPFYWAFSFNPHTGIHLLSCQGHTNRFGADVNFLVVASVKLGIQAILLLSLIQL